jgi:hypothetical protein
MNGINKIFLAGNIARKPALHKNKNGKVFSFLKMATNRFSYKEGQWDKKTDWHSVLVWGKKAELCERFLEDKMFIIAEDVHFLGMRTTPSNEPPALEEQQEEDEERETLPF